MELRQLMIFRELARQLSFTRTASALNYTQSNITAHIQALEASLGTPLFDRLGKKVVLTEAGQRLLPYAEQVLQLVDEARAQVGEEHGAEASLSIGSAETVLAYMLPPVIHACRERLPHLKLAFRLGTCAGLPGDLLEGRVSLAFLLERPASKALVVEPLREEPILLVAPADHPLTGRSTIQPDEIQGETILLTERTCSYRNRFEERMGAAVEANQIVEFSSLEAIKRCLFMGMGIAPLPRAVVDGDLREGRLAPINLAGPAMAVMTHIAWHKDKRMSPAMRAFRTLVLESFAGPGE